VNDSTCVKCGRLFSRGPNQVDTCWGCELMKVTFSAVHESWKLDNEMFKQYQQFKSGSKTVELTYEEVLQLQSTVDWIRKHPKQFSCSRCGLPRSGDTDSVAFNPGMMPVPLWQRITCKRGEHFWTRTADNG